MPVINLRFFQGQVNMPSVIKTALVVEGPQEAIDPAIKRIEDRLLDFLQSRAETKLLMHDIAAGNPRYYQHRKGLVYQRDPDQIRVKNKNHWRWMCVEEIPEDLMHGECDRKLIKGSTGCLVWNIRNTQRKKSFVYICGRTWLDVNSCRDRACDQIREAAASSQLRTVKDA
jgi:hypothetical protein